MKGEIGPYSFNKESYPVPAPAVGDSVIPGRWVFCLVMEERVVDRDVSNYAVIGFGKTSTDRGSEYKLIGMGILQDSEPSELESADLFGDMVEWTRASSWRGGRILVI